MNLPKHHARCPGHRVGKSEVVTNVTDIRTAIDVFEEGHLVVDHGSAESGRPVTARRTTETAMAKRTRAAACGTGAG